MAVSTSHESSTVGADAAAIRPFRIEIAQEEIDELRRRVRATRWPDPETVSDRSQGVQLAKLRPRRVLGRRLRLPAASRRAMVHLGCAPSG
jgi:hypothetical protein